MSKLEREREEIKAGLDIIDVVKFKKINAVVYSEGKSSISMPYLNGTLAFIKHANTVNTPYGNGQILTY